MPGRPGGLERTVQAGHLTLAPPPGYHLGNVVGRGASSEIRQAVQLSTNRVVAIKLLHPETVGAGGWRRFEAERRALGELSSHAEIVTVFDAGVVEDRPWIAMEFCSRGSLAGRDPLAVDAAVEVLRSISAALAAAHAAGFRHGDVKPGNIMLTDRGTAALADFGLSKLAAARSATSSVRGYTPDHVPPELLKGHDSGFPGDVYSLGTTIWQLLMGRPPFRTADDEALAVVMLRILQEPVPELDRADVAPWLRDLVQRMTTSDPAARPTAQEVMAELAERPVVAGVFGTVPSVVAEDVSGYAAESAAESAPGVDTGSTQLWARADRPSAPAPPAIPTPPPAAPPPRRRMLIGSLVAATVVALLTGAALTVPGSPVRILETGGAVTAAPAPSPTTVPTPTTTVQAAAPVTSDPAPAPVTADEEATQPDPVTSPPPRPLPNPGGTNGGDNDDGGNGGTTPAPVQQVQVAQPVPASAWQSFGGAGMSVGTGAVSLTTPENDYSALRGAFAPVSGCDYQVSFDAQEAHPAGSGGYGYAVGIRSGLTSGGVPNGWSLQYDYNAQDGSFHHRAAVLPDDASRATAETFDSSSDSGWHRTVVTVQGSSVTTTFDGAPAGAGRYGLSGGCGSGVVLRVWGTNVDFRNVTVKPL